MTLVLTLATPLAVVQASDRLVTLRPRHSGEAPRPYDVLANKSILYQAQNALVTIGYSGIAFINGCPTDEWLAEQIWAQKLPRMPGKTSPVSMALGHAPKVRDIGLTVIEIAQALKAILRVNRAQPLFLTIAGYQWSRKDRRPIVIELSCSADTGGEVVVDWGLRRWPPTQNVRLYNIGAGLTPDEINALHSALQAAPDWDRTRDALVEAIRRVSGRERSVGPHVMAVSIFANGSARIKFVPAEQHAAAVRSGGRSYVGPVSYSSWIIGPCGFQSPSIQVGSGKINVGGLDIEIDIPGPRHVQDGLLSLQSSQSRPRPPGVKP